MVNMKKPLLYAQNEFPSITVTKARCAGCLALIDSIALRIHISGLRWIPGTENGNDNSNRVVFCVVEGHSQVFIYQSPPLGGANRRSFGSRYK
jgi:hypothetical protein